MIPMLPIPVDGPVSPILTIVFALAGLAVFGVLVWQAVRYFRANPRDDDTDRDGDVPGPR